MIFHVAPGEDVSNHLQLLPMVVLELIPRSRELLLQPNVPFLPEATEHRQALPGYLAAAAPRQHLAVIESHFYIDLATADTGGQYVARRRVTLKAVDLVGNPVSGIWVEWSRTQGSAELRFLNAAGEEREALEGQEVGTTDEHGLAEVTLQHPVAEVAEADRTLRIRAQVGYMEVELELLIVRNDAVTRMSDVRTQGPAERLLVYQPVANARSPRNEAIVELQEMLNEVVSRHRGIQPFTFIPLDGVFGDETRDALRSYLTHFRTINGQGDYPYNLQNIGPSRELSDYLRTEYAPFDPANVPGSIVDRHLLIGEQDDTAPAAIDGLAELYEGVVQRLKQEMVRVAESYVECDTFWLHRTQHQPYQAATAYVFRCTTATTLKAAPTPQSVAVMVGTVPVTLAAGGAFDSPSTQNGWTQITHPSGNGWVPSTTGRRVRDDQGVARNAGTHGGAGVAYSFGCKDLPAAYTAQLESNTHAPPAAGAGNLRRIAAWEEYQTGHRVGRMASEDGWAGDNTIPGHTGCDCSGFTQNCITQALLPDQRRVVPQELLQAIVVNQNRVPLHAIGSGSFVGTAATAKARPIPHPDTEAERSWVRQGDLIANAGHIVWFADERPAALTGQNTFEVFNEYGSYSYQLPNGVTAPIDTTRFLRKAIRMPFHYWRRTLGGLSLGKVYIWR